jgi:hypothetical protein
MKPARTKFTVLKQTMELIPRNLVPKLAREHGVQGRCRTFSAWSHVVSMVFAQLSHALSLNDICDTLGNHSGALRTVREATPPSRNGLSHANRTRNADMAEALFWRTLSALRSAAPGFGMGRKYCGFPRRFKRVINVVDSTTIQLVANCMDWAKHRRRKAAAKCHMRLDLQSFLPRFALIKAANTGDVTEARAVCAGIKSGEIVAFDKAYVNFPHLFELTQRGVFWVTRAKDNMQYRHIAVHSEPRGRVLQDIRVQPTGQHSHRTYPDELRLVEAIVEINGEDQCMRFITDNFDWAATSICDLYKARWGIEVFFKQIKQTLKVGDFLGYSENVIRWQLWTALLTYVLLRFIAYRSRWRGSFPRLFTALRGVLWDRLNMYEVLRMLDGCGTAHGPPRMVAVPSQAYLPGFAVQSMGQHVSSTKGKT